MDKLVTDDCACVFERACIAARVGGNSIYYHKWLRSDPRDLHDHFYDCVTLVLSVGLFEETPEGRFWRAPGEIIFRKAEEPHRIEIDPEKPPPETLFIVGPVRREMGFYTDAHGWLSQDRYYAKVAGHARERRETAEAGSRPRSRARAAGAS